MERKTVLKLAAAALAAPVVASIPRVQPTETAQAAPDRSRAQQVAMVIVTAIRLGPDNKLHDAFTPTRFSAPVGQQVEVTVYNYDTGEHSFIAPGLGLNVVIPAARRIGVPATKTFSFTPRKAGSFSWHCMMSCDTEAGGWAMAHPGFMAGSVTITPAA